MTVTISGLGANAFGGSGFPQQEAVISLLITRRSSLWIRVSPCLLVAEHHRGLTVELTVPLKVGAEVVISICARFARSYAININKVVCYLGSNQTQLLALLNKDMN